MSKEAFYLHLVKKVHEAMCEDSELASTMPVGVRHDIERAVSGDIPPFWLQDAPWKTAITIEGDKLSVFGSLRITGGKPNTAYSVQVGPCGYCAITDSEGNARGHSASYEVEHDFKASFDEGGKITDFSAAFIDWPEGWQDFSEPAHKPINWPAVMNQAVVDVSRDGCRNAAQAMPWITGRLLMDAKSGMGGDDE